MIRIYFNCDSRFIPLKMDLHTLNKLHHVKCGVYLSDDEERNYFGEILVKVWVMFNHFFIFASFLTHGIGCNNLNESSFYLKYKLLEICCHITSVVVIIKLRHEAGAYL